MLCQRGILNYFKAECGTTDEEREIKDALSLEKAQGHKQLL